MNKIIVSFIVALSVLTVSAKVYAAECGGFFQPACPDTYKEEADQLSTIQDKLIRSVPIPQLQTSQERLNIKRRAELFNSEDKISYIYLVSYGKVMAFYTVKGKVSSSKSYMTPQEKLVDGHGNKCSNYTDPCYVITSPDVDGSYGQNPDSIFFFTTEGAYVEWKGDYMMSDQPLKLTQQPELIREIK